MIFIDGGFLRQLSIKYNGHDRIDYEQLAVNLVNRVNKNRVFQADLIRIYYYDAIVDANDPEHKEQREYFMTIANKRFYTLRLGRLVRSLGATSAKKPKFRQKGVDILMAIDALSMAYENHYVTGVFIVGDADFLPLIEAVKDAGRKTVVISDPKMASLDLLRAFDDRISIREENAKELLPPRVPKKK